MAAPFVCYEDADVSSRNDDENQGKSTKIGQKAGRRPLSTLGGNGNKKPIEGENIVKGKANDEEKWDKVQPAETQENTFTDTGFSVFEASSSSSNRQAQLSRGFSAATASQSDFSSAMTRLPRLPLQSLSSQPLDEVKRRSDELFDDSGAAVISPMSVDKSGLVQENLSANKHEEQQQEAEDDGDDEETEFFTAPPPSEREKHEDQIFCSPEFADDILDYMKLRERLIRPKANYLRKQSEIKEEMRQILVDWLVDVTLEYNLEKETLFLAVNYVDRVLSIIDCPKSKLQLVGTTAMMIACKYEEIYPPDNKEFVYITDDTYTLRQVIKMEKIVLETLDFQVAAPTPYWFLSQYLKFCRSNKKTTHLANYLIELSLLGSEYIQFLPSHLAAAAICLANLMTGPVPWPESLEKKSCITLIDFYSILTALLDAFKKAKDDKHKAIYEQYVVEQNLEVALLAAPESLPALGIELI